MHTLDRSTPYPNHLLALARAGLIALACVTTANPAQARPSPPGTSASEPARAAPASRLSTVTVTAPSAIEGFHTPPKHSYEIDGDDLRHQSASRIPDVLADKLPGVSLTHEQGNDLQPTLRFNGFAASPLLGTPQGLSVFQDGVRVNEPFGDTVNWDLLPTDAIRSVSLVPFADPVYGLNTLGGAILVRTLDGKSAPGGDVGVEAGSFGRTGEHVRLGTAAGDWSYFVAAQNGRENGWAPYTASSTRTLFLKATRDADGNQLDLSYTFGQSHLAGSQSLPGDWLRTTPTAVYSAPDWFDNQLNFFNVGDTQVLSRHWQVTGRIYVRNSDQSGLNSNLNNNIDNTQPVSLDNPVALNVASMLHQQSRGLTLALRNDASLAGMPNVATLGVEYTHQTVGFTQTAQAAAIDPDRYTVGVGPFNQNPVDLGVIKIDRSVAFTDNLSPARWLDLNLGARLESARIEMTDLLGGPLGGSHDDTRFNPSAGLDIHPTPRTSYYLRYAQSMRTPMPVELTCASPSAPCTLPNVLVADPDLKPVIAHTAQAGAVWRLGGLRMHAAYTQTRLADALQFVSLANMTQGYFTNIPNETFRTVSLDLNGAIRRWTWTASISRTLATYGSAFLEQSANNSTANAAGNIQVQPGDRLPDIPLWTATVSAQFSPTPRLHLSGEVVAYSDRYAQGDENNLDVHGTIPGYAVVNLGARYEFARHWRADLSVNNLFNRVYADFGQLGENAFSGPGRSYNSDPDTWPATRFVGVGAPRGVWLGVSYAWD